MEDLVMKWAIGMAIAIGVIVLVSGALSSALGPAKHPKKKDAGVKGGLEIGAISELQKPVTMWREPRGHISAQDRDENLMHVLQHGQVFIVENHIPDDELWVEIVLRDRPMERGWIRSPPDEPVEAFKIGSVK